MSVDQGYEAYRRAMAEAEAEVGEQNEDWRNSNLRTARFELQMLWPVPEEIHDSILASFGHYLERKEVRVTKIGDEVSSADWAVLTWDVEEPSMHGAAVKNLEVRAAELTEHDAYLVWHAVTGFPMLYEGGEES